METKFEAADGKIFNNISECEKYEHNLKKQIQEKIKSFVVSKNNTMNVLSVLGYPVIINVCLIKLPNKEAVETIIIHNKLWKNSNECECEKLRKKLMKSFYDNDSILFYKTYHYYEDLECLIEYNYMVSLNELNKT